MTTALRSRAIRSGATASEREELCLKIRVRGWNELPSETARAPDRLVDRRQELKRPGHCVGVELIILASGSGKVPRVDQGVGAQQSSHQLLERLLAEAARAGLVRPARDGPRLDRGPCSLSG